MNTGMRPGYSVDDMLESYTTVDYNTLEEASVEPIDEKACEERFEIFMQNNWSVPKEQVEEMFGKEDDSTMMTFTRDEIMEAAQESSEEIILTALEPVRVQWKGFTLKQLRNMDRLSFFPSGENDLEMDIQLSKWLSRCKTLGRWEILMQTRIGGVFYRMEATQNGWFLTFSKKKMFITLVLVSVSKAEKQKLREQPYTPETNCVLRLENYFYLSARNTSSE